MVSIAILFNFQIPRGFIGFYEADIAAKEKVSATLIKPKGWRGGRVHLVLLLIRVPYLGMDPAACHCPWASPHHSC